MDLDALLAVLDPDVVLRSDGSGLVTAARCPVHGADRVARLLLHLLRLAPDATVQPAYVNGTQGLIAQRDGRPIAALALDVAAGRITAVNRRNSDQPSIGEGALDEAHGIHGLARRHFPQQPNER